MRVCIDGCQRVAMKLVLSFHLNVASRTQVPGFVLETPLPSESSFWQNATHLINTAIPPCLSYVTPIVLLHHTSQWCRHVRNT